MKKKQLVSKQSLAPPRDTIPGSDLIEAYHRREKELLALQDEGIVSMAGVPLLLERRVLGILYVADRHSRTYSPQEVALLLSLATHAALAMENARLFEETRAAFQALEAKTADTQAAIAVHEQLISLIAKGGGLEDLAKMMASILRGVIVVLDEEYYTACMAFDQDFTSTKQIDELG